MASWLKNTKRHTIVISELSTKNGETPDIIGWLGHASSTLIECKVSRSDFLSDKKKWFRQRSYDGMGDMRYFAAPKGLLSVNEIPEGWGLLEVDGNRFVRKVKKAELLEANKNSECVMLMSALRRLKISTAVYVVQKED